MLWLACTSVLPCAAYIHRATLMQSLQLTYVLKCSWECELIMLSSASQTLLRQQSTI